VGFIDADTSRHGSRLAGLPVLGGDEWLQGEKDVAVIPALGSPSARAELVERLRAAGIPLFSVIHPSASLGPRSKLAAGVIICPGVVISCDVSVGTAAIVNYGAKVAHDGVLGACCFVGPGANLGSSIGVGREAYVGIGASIMQDLSIGARATVGAGATVTRHVAPCSTVVGVPAQPIRHQA
jgi:sugar O-acyltransferase (sialic acid O-acetyltransferase NeuD family)